MQETGGSGQTPVDRGEGMHVNGQVPVDTAKEASVELVTIETANAQQTVSDREIRAVPAGPGFVDQCLELFCCCFYGPREMMTEDDAHGPVHGAPVGQSVRLAKEKVENAATNSEGLKYQGELEKIKGNNGVSVGLFILAHAQMEKNGERGIQEIEQTIDLELNEKIASEIALWTKNDYFTTNGLASIAGYLIKKNRFDLVKILVNEGFKNLKPSGNQDIIAMGKLGLKLIEAKQYDLAAVLANQMKDDEGTEFKAILLVKDETYSDTHLGKDFKLRLIFNVFLDRVPMTKKQEMIGEYRGFGVVSDHVNPLLASALECGEKGLEPGTVEVLKTLSQSFALTLSEKIYNASEGDFAELLGQALVKYGICVFEVGSRGHSLRCSLKADPNGQTFSMILYNTGEGINSYSHCHDSKTNRYLPFLLFPGFKLVEIDKFCSNPHFVRLVGMGLKDRNRPIGIDGVYQTVFDVAQFGGGDPMKVGEKPPESKYKEFYEEDQDRGSCVASGFFTMVRTTILRKALEEGRPLADALMEWKIVKARMLDTIWGRLSKGEESKKLQEMYPVVQRRVEKTGRYLLYAEIAADDKKFGEFLSVAKTELLSYGLFPEVPSEGMTMHQRIALLRQLSDDLVHKWYLDELQGWEVKPNPALKAAFSQYKSDLPIKSEERQAKYLLNILRDPRNTTEEGNERLQKYKGKIAKVAIAKK